MKNVRWLMSWLTRMLPPPLSFYTPSTLQKPVQERPIDQARELAGLGKVCGKPEVASHVATRNMSPLSLEKSGGCTASPQEGRIPH